MTFNDLLAIKGYTVYSLSKSCSIPKTTLFDIATSKTDIQECTGRTLRILAKALGVTIEKLLDLEKESSNKYPSYVVAAIKKVRGSLTKEPKYANIYVSQLYKCLDVAQKSGAMMLSDCEIIKSRYKLR